jgi:regulator of sirC expression with transglutaminase-like and TPR domain
MDFPIARQQFIQEIQQPTLDLARAALLLAQEEYPDLDLDVYLNRLNSMAAAIADRLPSERYPLRIIQTINRYLYDDLQFSGNQENYYDPRNSYLNEVIDRRMGIPITLSLVYLEVAKRLDFPMEGVGLPGHFLIRPVAADMEILVDPFHRGEVLFTEDAQERLSQIYGRSIPMQPEFLEATSPRQFLARMLTNLKVIYLNSGDLRRGRAASDRILLLFPDAAHERRDRGLLAYQLGDWSQARLDLSQYLEQMPNATDAATVRQLLDRMPED